MTKQRKKDEDDDLPATASANKKVLTKGFGFVWMLSKKDVERAIEGCNVITVCAGTAETLVVKSPSRKMIPRMTMDSGEDSDEGRLGLLNGENEDNSDVGSEQDEEENDEKPVKPQLPDPEAGATLSRFRAYGPLRYARITLDPATSQGVLEMWLVNLKKTTRRCEKRRINATCIC